MRPARLIAAWLLLSLTACGFTPLYQQKAETHDQASFLASIAIEPQRMRLHQQVRTELENLLGGAGQEKPFLLTFTLTANSYPFGIQPDGTVLRYNVVAEAYYQLIRKSDGARFSQGMARVIASYNVLPDSDFATYIASREAFDRATQQMAEELRARLITAFYRPEIPPPADSHETAPPPAAR